MRVLAVGGASGREAALRRRQAGHHGGERGRESCVMRACSQTGPVLRVRAAGGAAPPAPDS